MSMSVVFSHAYLDDADRVKTNGKGVSSRNIELNLKWQKMAAIQKLNPTDLSKSLFL